MTIILETPRLILRQFVLDDAENIYLLNLDPEVVQYTGDVSFESVEHARAFLSNYNPYAAYGYGRWAVIEKDTQETLGWCGLKYLVDEKETDIGYRFMKKYWGKGYATESAKACLDYGFKNFELDFIVGNAMNANPASIKVLEKIGLKFHKQSPCGGEPGVQYIISREDWEKNGK